jgi:GNAT superfamily N-acetyltransferase
MEDQEGMFQLDTRKGEIVGGFLSGDIFDDDSADGMSGGDDEHDGDTDVPGRFIALPEWDSAEGFRLMEKFAVSFKNALVRDKLTRALDRGRGVFRAFKDALAAHPEAEQLWFAFKDREMRRVVLDWYNGLREEWGLERIGGEPEETGDLVREDFRFRPPLSADQNAVEALHRRCLAEIREQAEKSGLGSGAADLIACRTDPVRFGGHTALIAETGTGDFAAYIALGQQDDTLHITALEVKSEYRGLGIGEALLDKLLEGLDRTEGSKTTAANIIMELPEAAGEFARVLHREGFTPFTTAYTLKLRE